MNGAPAKPMRGTRSASALRTRRTVSNTKPTASSTSTAGSARAAAAVRTGRAMRGPSPGVNSSPTPSGSSTSRMSAKRIAASTPRRSTGCSVTSAAASGLLHSSRKPSRARTARYSGM